MILQTLKDWKRGTLPIGKTRSAKWPAVRRAHLEQHPVCTVCGGKKDLEVHHIVPFHDRPELELDPSNLITLCESKANGVNCHLWFGHLGNFRSVNPESPGDAAGWYQKFSRRTK